MSSDPCSEHGLYDELQRKCVCDLEYSFSPEDCSVPFSEVVGIAAWSTYTYTVLALFTVAACVSAFLLGKSIATYRKSVRQSRTPKKRSLVFVLVFLASILRVIFYAVDPYGYRDIFGLVIMQLLYGLPFPLIGSAFAFVLIIWADTYNMYTGDSIPFLAKVPVVVLTLSAAMWVIEVTIRLLIALRIHIDTMMTLWEIYYAVFVLILGVGYAMYGIRLYRWLTSSFAISARATFMIKKISWSTIMACIVPACGVVITICMYFLDKKNDGWHFLWTRFILDVTQFLCVLTIMYAASNSVDRPEMGFSASINEVTEQLLREFCDDLSMVPSDRKDSIVSRSNSVFKLESRGHPAMF
eukprot:GILK01007995.1.p1 GENE.GILK01007995.1~~GILK01007995.1.p1  ORF type:complete len:355 (-),score=13.51 GILK01007995.1:44-1108(-)